MLSRMIVRRWCLLGIAAVTTAMIAAISATTVQATFCPSGNLCLFEPNGQEVQVPAGQSRDFKPPLPVDEINNRTIDTYCLTIKLSNGSILLTSIAAGQDETNLRVSVISVSPGPVCPG